MQCHSSHNLLLVEPTSQCLQFSTTCRHSVSELELTMHADVISRECIVPGRMRFDVSQIHALRGVSSSTSSIRLSAISDNSCASSTTPYRRASIIGDVYNASIQASIASMLCGDLTTSKSGWFGAMYLKTSL